MRIKKFFEDIVYSFKSFLWKITPKYKGRSIFTKEYWDMFWDRRTKGFDISDTWSLDYTITKFIAPRIRKFIDVADISIPTIFLTEEQQKSIAKGYKWNKQYWRLENKKENKRCFQRAAKRWVAILTKIAEGFEDELFEEEHWTEWNKKWKPEVDKINKKLNKAKSEAERKKIWEELKSGREYRKDIVCCSEDIVYNLRYESKQLLFKYYNNLWW